MNAKVKASLAVQSVMKEMEHSSVELAGELRWLENDRGALGLESYGHALLRNPEKNLFRASKFFVPTTVAHHKVNLMILCVIYRKFFSAFFLLQKMFFEMKGFIAIKDIYLTNC